MSNRVEKLAAKHAARELDKARIQFDTSDRAELSEKMERVEKHIDEAYKWIYALAEDK